MKYRSFNYQQVNGKVPPRRSKIDDKQRRVKFIFVVVAVVIGLFAVKLVVTPLVSALVTMVKESSATISYLISKQGLKKDTDGYTNLLLLGIDQREVGSSMLTDTIIIMRYRDSDKKVVMISIPRDLWVKIPAFNTVQSYYTKINSVYTIGKDYEYNGQNINGIDSGLGLLSLLIKNNLGYDIHYAAQINFNSFKNIIDAMGGIDVDVENTFTDYEYPREGYENAPMDQRYEIVSFQSGLQHMDGEMALKYARSRHAMGIEGSDFARARRQQKVILAMKDKLLSSETLLNLNVLKELYATVSQEVDTNIRLSELPMMYDIFKQVGDQVNEIKLIVLNNDSGQEGGLLYVPDASLYGGAYVLLPINGWDALRTDLNIIIDQQQ